MTPHECLDALDSLLDKATHGPFQHALHECVNVFHIGVADNFERAEEWDGGSWPPHSPVTVQIHGPHPLLILTGKMLAAATEATAVGSVVQIDDTEILVGIDPEVIPYATVHQYGAGNVPRRQFFYASDQVLDECEDLLAEELLTAFHA